MEFKVSSATLVPEKNQVVLQGLPSNGTVKPGMKVRAAASVTPEISGVAMSMKDGRFEVGLILQFGSSGELDAWKSLNVGPGEALTISS